MSELDLGLKLREKRMKMGLSLRKTASLSGITPSMLSQIENGVANPSISTLRAVAGVLELALYELFKDEEAPDPIVRAENRRIIGDKNEKGTHYELLTRDTKGEIEFCQISVAVGCSSYNSPISHKGEEVAMVLCGKARLTLSGKDYELSEGDSLRIEKNAPHIWHNIGTSKLIVIFAVTPPSF